jgi:hypothetical protein
MSDLNNILDGITSEINKVLQNFLIPQFEIFQQNQNNMKIIENILKEMPEFKRLERENMELKRAASKEVIVIIDDDTPDVLFKIKTEPHVLPEAVPVLTEPVPVSTELVPVLTEPVPVLTEPVPVLPEAVPVSTELVPVLPEPVPVIRLEVFERDVPDQPPSVVIETADVNLNLVVEEASEAVEEAEASEAEASEAEESGVEGEDPLEAEEDAEETEDEVEETEDEVEETEDEVEETEDEESEVPLEEESGVEGEDPLEEESGVEGEDPLEEESGVEGEDPLEEEDPLEDPVDLEVFMFKIPTVGNCYVTSETNGEVYSIIGDEEVGDVIGHLKNSVFVRI